MKFTSVIVTVVVAVLVQIALARYAVGGRWAFDLVLVGVVFAALQGGAVAGMLAGTVGGLLQDLLSGGIVGVGGLAKTLVGCMAGVIGTRFMLAQPSARMLIMAAATVVHRLMMVALQALVDLQWLGVSWPMILIETGLNAAAALVLFLMAQATPGLIARQRLSRRSSLSRRNW